MTTTEDTIETWENTTAGRVVLRKTSVTGHPRHEMVGGKRRFQLTSTERRLNQEMAANAKLDIFSNGTLQPVSGVNEELMSALRENPNIIGAEDDIAQIFKLKGAAFAKRISNIDNAAALERLLDAASAEKIDATMSQVEKLTARLAEVSPSVVDVVVTHGETHDPSASLKGVTPR